MILHRRALTLHNELGLAQTAFAQDDSEANLAWIRDLQAQISAIDGTEAERERPEAWGEVGSDGE